MRVRMRYSIISTLTCTLLFSGCELLGSTPDICVRTIERPFSLGIDFDAYKGTASALRNSEQWPFAEWQPRLYAISSGENSNTLALVLNVYNELGFQREGLSFRGIPKRLGLYALPRQIAEQSEEQRLFFSTSQDDGDVGADYYVLDKTASSHIAITSYDPSGCMIEGTFSLTVVRDTRFPRVFPYPDTLHFSHGRFRTNVVTWPLF